MNYLDRIWHLADPKLSSLSSFGAYTLNSNRQGQLHNCTSKQPAKQHLCLQQSHSSDSFKWPYLLIRSSWCRLQMSESLTFFFFLKNNSAAFHWQYLWYFRPHLATCISITLTFCILTANNNCMTFWYSFTPASQCFGTLFYIKNGNACNEVTISFHNIFYLLLF